MKRLPKYYRAENPPAIRYFEFYLPVLALIAEYRYLDTSHIVALLEGNPKNISDKLKKLYHNEYVERVHPDVNPDSKRMIYALTRKGRDFLQESDPQKYGQVYYPYRERKPLFIRHELMISHFRACLEMALRRHPHAGLSFWAQGNRLKRLLANQQVKGAQIIPDGYFIIQNKRRELHYFLESDRGTMTLKRFYDKIKRYFKFFQQNRADTPKFFRVITIAQSPRRAENLRLITITGDPKQKGSHRFWFGSETDYSLENSKGILKDILKAGHIEAKQKLSLLS